ncbi:unnamed protein product [Amoebophrya sp. A25]|nr:unnamed protein product [Amoebophrya sp. A25]|eukprot:GSA25T00019786001.1
MSSYSVVSRRSSGSRSSGLQMARLLVASRGLDNKTEQNNDPLSALYVDFEKARLRYAVASEVKLIGISPDVLVLENWAFVMRAIEDLDVQRCLNDFRRGREQQAEEKNQGGVVVLTDTGEKDDHVDASNTKHLQPYEGTDVMTLRGELFVDENCDFAKLLGGVQNGLFGKKTTLKAYLWTVVALVKALPGVIGMSLKMAKAKDESRKESSPASQSIYDRSHMVGANLKGAEYKNLWTTQSASTNMYAGGTMAVRGPGCTAGGRGGDPEIVFQHREYLLADVTDCVKLAEQLHKEVIEWHVESGDWMALDYEDADGKREVRLLPATGDENELRGRKKRTVRKNSLVNKALTNVRQSYVVE